MGLYTWDGEPSAMVGETLVAIDGLKVGSERVEFRTASGRTFVMMYHQDCCASCDIEDVCGDVADLIGTPIVMAEDVSNASEPPKVEREHPAESETWTFVKFATERGYVTVRWYGSSNGYYSESPSWSEAP